MCRPASVVSGDYYDFLPSGPDQLGVAVGDISGKGISAALLMATIHSAVRAFEREPGVAARSAYQGKERRTAFAARNGRPSPSQVLRSLNHTLYKNTHPQQNAPPSLTSYYYQHHPIPY